VKDSGLIREVGQTAAAACIRPAVALAVSSLERGLAACQAEVAAFAFLHTTRLDVKQSASETAFARH